MIVAAAIVFATAAKADRRVALVIGNSSYRNASQLPNTINDANAVAALFRSVGFEVVNSRTDLGVLDFKRAVRDFLITAESADVAVVYYAGHGIEVNGTNYLIPVDAKLARDYDVEDEAVALDRIIWALQSVKRLRLILLDACRDNPFVVRLQRSVGIRAAAKGGLAKIDDVSADTLVGYAAKAGSVSYDGDGPNSPFASALLKHIAEPGLDIRIALGRVRDDVVKSTGGKQEPYFYGSLGGAIIPLVPLAPKKIEPVVAPPAVAAREPASRPEPAIAPAQPSRIEKPAPTIGNAIPAKPEPAKPEPPKAPQPSTQAALERDDPALACGRDEQRLARLRSNPVAGRDRSLSERTFLQSAACPGPALVRKLRRRAAGIGIAGTDTTDIRAAGVRAGPPRRRACPKVGARARASELAKCCEFGARPGRKACAAPYQSGADQGDPSKAQHPSSQAALDSNDPALACGRDELRLTQLRSNPVPDEIARFQRELSCSRLRAQVQRLFESVAIGPPAAAPLFESVAPAAIRRSGPVVPGVDVSRQAPPVGPAISCARDAERLARLREDPTLEAIARFEKELGCEHIRPQLQRLRESMGQ